MMSDNFEFQKAGDVCENCEARWRHAGKPLMTLRGLPTFTMRYHAPIAICVYCDGPVLNIANATAERREIDASNK